MHIAAHIPRECATRQGDSLLLDPQNGNHGANGSKILDMPLLQEVTEEWCTLTSAGNDLQVRVECW